MISLAKNIFKNSLKGMVVFAFLSSGMANASVIFMTSGGKLVGAQDVDVGGTLWDVAFKMGSFNDIFGIGSAANFDATTSSQATAFSNALLGQVLVGTYDTNIQSADPCYAATNDCRLLTPYSLNSTETRVRFSQAINSATEASDGSSLGNYFVERSVINGTRGWADWSLSSLRPITLVSEPGMLVIFLLGFAGLMLRRKG